MQQQQQNKQKKTDTKPKRKSLITLTVFFYSCLGEIRFYSLRGSSTVKSGHYLYRQSLIWAGVSEGPDLVLLNCTTRRYLTRGTCCFVPSTWSHTGNRFSFFSSITYPRWASSTVFLILPFHDIFHLKILKSIYNREKWKPFKLYNQHY